MSSTKSLVRFLGDNTNSRKPYDFIIPHYQRGYRWGPQEVNELLDDLWSFCKDVDSGDFYCIQPIVVLKRDAGGYEVLDGQQRLTTLYLILSFLEERRFEDGYDQEMFTLNYETRKDSEEYLQSKEFIKGITDENIDYYHISRAYQTIKEWFSSSEHRGAKGKLIPILLDDDSKGNRNVRFIWYEVASHTPPIDVFIRLNVGKIPLTDAELTKALLLQRDRYDKDELKFIERRLFEIASEWDRIEYTLQQPELWYFLNNQYNDKPTHIELIFDLIADRLQKEFKYFDKRPIKHGTFLILSKYFDDMMSNGKMDRIDVVHKIWEYVTTYYEYFSEWYDNRKLYHYIGFLISQNGRREIEGLINKAKKKSKKKFIEYLEGAIGEMIWIDKSRKDAKGNMVHINELEQLVYEVEGQSSNDKFEIHRILLLHNIHASLKSDKEKARFPFNLYKKTKNNEKWSLEHIHAQNTQILNKKANQRTWLEDHVRSFEKQKESDFVEIVDKIKALLDKKEIEQKEFETLYGEVYSAIRNIPKAKGNEMHSIVNLCLIDAATNSKLNNSVFDVKREKIKEQEIEGHYIPICTRNVFMKNYTKYPVSNAYWTEEDRAAYLENIKATYDYFISKINNEEK